MLVLITGHPLALGCVLWHVRLFLGAICSQTTDLFKGNKQPIVNTALWTAYLDKINCQKESMRRGRQGTFQRQPHPIHTLWLLMGTWQQVPLSDSTSWVSPGSSGLSPAHQQQPQLSPSAEQPRPWELPKCPSFDSWGYCSDKNWKFMRAYGSKQ